ncbi:MAG: tRNA pseudouridine(55) synthase TruB, partial [Succinivibrionaceae bacterium]|nr:tRNA pseudouridine(55) synthase TruB [Succinivibrionaceae bacterium]
MGKAAGRDISGILLLDKPLGMSSAAALSRAKRLYGARKAGHTGALDPLASGVLPICLGEASKLSAFLLEGGKRYLATGRLGVVTSSADAEGEVVGRHEVGDAPARVASALGAFTGRITQIPPIYSAIKVNGRPLYKYARRGQEVEIPRREVEIYSLSLEGVEGDSFTISVHCSKGTYIRTLVADIGAALGCGAYVTMLRRTAVDALPPGPLTTLGRLEELAAAGGTAALDAL